MKNRILQLGFVAFIALLVTACSVPDYRPWTIGGGYRDEKLATDVWRLNYQSGFTAYETIQTYWLYRATEIALKEGYEGFEIVSNLHLSDSPSREWFKPYQLAAGAVYVPIIVPNGDGGNGTMMEGDIHLLHRPFEQGPYHRFDARLLQDRLKPYVFGKKCSSDNVCAHAHWYLYQP
jgi:hypothetical protein